MTVATDVAVRDRHDTGRAGRPAGSGRANPLAGWLFLSPSLLLFAVFILGPFMVGLGMSLFSYDLLTPPKFVGLDNFRRVVEDGLLLHSLRNTFVFAFASMVTHLAGGLLLAIAVNRGINKVLSYFVRTAVFFPFLISWAAVALLWKYVLDPTFGIFSYYLKELSIDPPGWFTDPAWALPSIIGIDFWHTIGYTFLIMLAGLQTVPSEMVEAARCDGANRFQTFFHITLPMMSPTMFFASVITFIGAFQIFDPIQIITRGGPNDSTISVVMYLYQTTFQAFQVGYGSTIALAVFVVIMGVTLLQFWGSRKWVHNA
ncbi:carbohydrate ABC transporter permease [Actinopolymorpha singaporensis]|uniref:Multiple sugar transport system permease protein n=1 Tax=Actinopolymorpha singaporensis TaxID=117157 RepID=A0A1H1U421_9ACTN|nr:multiple sugar transport system permease protein [Actinopolymorpha singaporensis]